MAAACQVERSWHRGGGTFFGSARRASSTTSELQAESFCADILISASRTQTSLLDAARVW